MPEILTQEEIDALLSALHSGELAAEDVHGEAETRKVKPYDFRRPDKFSKDQLRTLQMLHEHLARLLGTSFTSYMRTVVEMKVVSVQQMTYEEFTRSLPSPTCLCLFRLEPLPGEAIFELNTEVALALVERLLGGQGQVSLDRSRELTDIEQTVLTRILARGLTSFKEAWQNVAEVEARLERLEMNPQFTQIVAPNQMVVIITLTMKVGDEQGFLNVCLPDSLLEPVIPKLSAHLWFATGQSATAETVAVLRRRVEKMRVELVAVAGTASVRFGDLLALEVGDVIQLDSSVSNPIPVYVGSKVKFWARPGVRGSRLALQIVSSASDGGDNND